MECILNPTYSHSLAAQDRQALGVQQDSHVGTLGIISLSVFKTLNIVILWWCRTSPGTAQWMLQFWRARLQGSAEQS